jgi:hypothetical protein
MTNREAMTQEEKIREHVDECIDKYKSQCGLGFMVSVPDPETREHVVNCGTSILMTKWGICPGGGFAQAVVDNNLSEAFGRADSVNEDALKFYVMLMYNSSYID